MPLVDLIDHLRYHRWATAQLLDAAASLPPDVLRQNRSSSHGGIFDTLQHIFMSDALWLARLQGNPNAQPVAPADSLDSMASRWSAVHDGFLQWASSLPDDRWTALLPYRRLNGQSFEDPIWQIVLHIVNHGTLHRGQVMAMFRQAGVKPPATDLIFYYRSKAAAA